VEWQEALYILQILQILRIINTVLVKIVTTDKDMTTSNWQNRLLIREEASFSTREIIIRRRMNYAILNKLKHEVSNLQKSRKVSLWGQHSVCVCVPFKSRTMKPILTKYLVWLWSPRNYFNVRHKGSLWFDRTKDMSVHVSTCTNYDFNALTPIMWKLWRWYDVCISTSRRKNECNESTLNFVQN
jgi:hypothetical protein